MSHPYYYVTTHNLDGKPSIAIHWTHGQLREVVYPSVEARDAEYALLQDERDINEFAVKHGLPPAPVETFLDFGGFAFDARDVLAISIEQPPTFAGEKMGHPWIKCYFRGDRGERFFHAPFHDDASLREGYARIVAAMKASRS